MTDSDDDYSMRMTRREALAGGSAAAVAAGAALYSDALVTRAKALSAGDARIVMGDQGESPAQNGEITHNSGDVEVYSGGAVRNLTDPTFASVTTDEGTITNESLASGYRSTATTGIAAGTATNILDTEKDDIRNELNSSLQFVPDKTDYYFFSAQTVLTNSADQDLLFIRLRDTTASSNVLFRQLPASGSGSVGIGVSGFVDLTQGNVYEFQAFNNDSSFGISQGEDRTYAAISRSVVQP